MVSFSWLDPNRYRIGVRRDTGRLTCKYEIYRLVFSCLWARAWVPANRKWGAGNPRHVVVLLLTKVSPMVDWDKVPQRHIPWQPEWCCPDCQGSIDDYKNCGVGWILLRALEHLQRKNDKLRSINSHSHLLWEPESFHDSPYRSSYFLQPQGWYCWKSNTKFNCAGCWITMRIEFTSRQIAHVKFRVLIGKEGGPETWNGDICETQMKLMISNRKWLWASHMGGGSLPSIVWGGYSSST